MIDISLQDTSDRLHREIIEQSVNGYTEESERTRFHDRDEEAMKEAESCLDRLIPSSENAFLLREAYRRRLLRLKIDVKNIFVIDTGS